MRGIGGGGRPGAVASAMIAVLVAACGAAPPAPSSSAPAPTITGSASAGTRSPDPGLREAAGRSIAGFVAFLGDPGRTYHVELTTTTTLGGVSQGADRWSADVRGRDYAATIRDAETALERVAVGGAEWNRPAGDAWTRSDRDPSAFVVVLEPAACLGNVRHLEAVARGSGPGELAFALTGPIDPVPPLATAGAADASVDARVVLAADGRPVSIACTMTAEVDAAAGGRQTLEATWDLAFTSAGGPIAVVPPAEAPTPTAVATRSPTPPPPLADVHPALARFAALVGDPGLSLRMVQTGTMVGLGVTFELDYEIAIAGHDFQAVLRLAGEEVEVRGIDGTAYVRTAGGSWTSGPLTDAVADGITDPWRYLGRLDELRRAGKADRPAGALEFVNTGPVEYQTGEMQDAGIVGEITSLTFTVMPDGTPVSLAFRATTPDGRGRTLEIDSVVRFSRVGEPVTIAVPED